MKLLGLLRRPRVGDVLVVTMPGTSQRNRCSLAPLGQLMNLTCRDVPPDESKLRDIMRGRRSSRDVLLTLAELPLKLFPTVGPCRSLSRSLTK